MALILRTLTKIHKDIQLNSMTVQKANKTSEGAGHESGAHPDHWFYTNLSDYILVVILQRPYSGLSLMQGPDPPGCGKSGRQRSNIRYFVPYG